jgi:type II secretory pathway pseudopilin PulG
MSGQMAPHRASGASDHGTTLVELVLVVAVVGALAAFAVPATAHSIDAGRARDAAGFIAARLRVSRQQAAFRTAAMGLVFDRANGRWQMRVCQDGNANGLRRADIAGGTDRCPEGPYDLADMFPGVTVDVDPALRGPDGEPGSSDPVRFGSSDIASFSPEGTGTAGSLYLRSARGRQFAVRVGNITGRTRVLEYDAGSAGWRLR